MLSLLKHQFLDSISSGLTGGSRQSRIRYTCLDASEHYLVFGANTGSLYFYERETLNFVHLITTVQEPITQLKFSPNENYLAIATLKNFDIIILEPKLQTRKEKIVHRTTDHKAEITNMLWSTLSPDNFRLYSSDESGVILATPIGAKAKGLFQTKIESDYLYKCDSRVVQLDFDAELNQLIASSLTRSILINFAKGSAVQVGKKLRDGTYGAVHYLMRQQTSVIGGDESGARDGADGMEEVPINQEQSAGSSVNEGEKKKYLVLSRPGKRLWRADSENAKVLQTLNFQGSLTQAQLLPLFEDFLSEEKKATPVLNNVNFSKLTPLGECLLSWTDKSLILIDVESVEIVQWHADAVGLQDLVVYNNEAYAIHADPIKISRIIFDVEAFVERLAKKGEWKRVIELIQKNQVFKVSWLEEISNLLAKSKTSTPEYVNSLKEIVETAKKFKPTESRSPEVVPKPQEEVPSEPQITEPEKPVVEPVNTDDTSSSTASEAPSEPSETQPLSTSQPIEVTPQNITDETTNGTAEQGNLNVSTSMPASQTEPIKISSPRAANSLPNSLSKETELPSSASSVNSSPSPSPSSSSIQLPKEQVMSSSPDSTDSSDRMTSSVTSNEPLSDNPLVSHKSRTKKGRKARMPVIAPLVTPVVFESSSEGNTPKSAPPTALSSKDISPAVPKKDTTPATNPLSSSQPSTPAVPRTGSAGTGTGTKAAFNNFLSSILPQNQPGTNTAQPVTTPIPSTNDKQPQQAKEKVQQVFNNFLDSIIPPAPQSQTQQPNTTQANPTPTTVIPPPKEDDPKLNTTVPEAAGTTQYPAAAVFVPEKKEPEKKDKFNLQKFTDQLRDKVKEEILPEAAKGLDEIKKFFKTGTLKKNDDKDKSVNEPAAPKAIEIEDVKTRFITEKVNALRRKPTNLVLPSKSTTLSTSIATSHVTRTEHQSDNERRRAAVLTPLLKQWLKYFDNELRQFIDLTSTNDKLFMKEEDKVQENGIENSGTTPVAASPLEMKFVSKKSIELLLTECYRHKAFNDTTSVNETDLMDNFIENYWGLFNYNEVYLYTWQSQAQSVLTKLDRRGEEFFSQLLETYETKAAEQQTSDELVLTSYIREAQLRKQTQQKINSEGQSDALQQIEGQKQWSLLLRNIDTLLSKNLPAIIQVLVNRSDEFLPSLVLENIGEKNRLQYLQKLLKERKIHRKDASLVQVLLKELIVECPPDRSKLFDDNNKISAEALKAEWSNGYHLMKILSNQNKWQFATKYAEDMTREHGFIKGLKLMLLTNKKYEDLITLTVELDDLDEFDNVLVKNPVTSTPANWAHLIRAVLAQSKATSDDQTNSQARRINLLFVAHRAIAALGPRTAVSVLQTCLKDQQTQLPASFFSAVLAETRAEVWAKLPIVRESLEVLDSHLWSVRSAALGAPFAEVFNHEIDSQVNDLNVDLPFVAIGANGQDEPNFEYVEHSPAYFEEANVHWGVSTNLTTHQCAQCMLPMSESNGTKIFISHPSQHRPSAPVHEKCYNLSH
jgi:hypothetical protein